MLPIHTENILSQKCNELMLSSGWDGIDLELCVLAALYHKQMVAHSIFRESLVPSSELSRPACINSIFYLFSSQELNVYQLPFTIHMVI